MNFEEKLRKLVIEAMKVQHLEDENGKPAQPVVDLFLFFSAKKMLIVAEILREIRTYDLAADVAALMNKLDEEK